VNRRYKQDSVEVTVQPQNAAPQAVPTKCALQHTGRATKQRVVRQQAARRHETRTTAKEQRSRLNKHATARNIRVPRQNRQARAAQRQNVSSVKRASGGGTTQPVKNRMAGRAAARRVSASSSRSQPCREQPCAAGQQHQTYARQRAQRRCAASYVYVLLNAMFATWRYNAIKGAALARCTTVAGTRWRNDHVLIR